MQDWFANANHIRLACPGGFLGGYQGYSTGWNLDYQGLWISQQPESALNEAQKLYYAVKGITSVPNSGITRFIRENPDYRYMNASAKLASGEISVNPCGWKHPCESGKNTCDKQNGMCIKDGPVRHTCGCKPGYKCTDGCGWDKTSHKCEIDPTYSPVIQSSPLSTCADVKSMYKANECCNQSGSKELASTTPSPPA